MYVLFIFEILTEVRYWQKKNGNFFFFFWNTMDSTVSMCIHPSHQNQINQNHWGSSRLSLSFFSNSSCVDTKKTTSLYTSASIECGLAHWWCKWCDPLDHEINRSQYYIIDVYWLVSKTLKASIKKKKITKPCLFWEDCQFHDLFFEHGSKKIHNTPATHEQCTEHNYFQLPKAKSEQIKIISISCLSRSPIY